MKKKMLFVIVLVSLLLTACGTKTVQDSCEAGKWNPFRKNITVGVGDVNPYNAGEKCFADGKFHPFIPESTTPTDPAPVDPAPTGTYFDACNNVELDDDITQLKNNGQVVANAFMFLDKNESEVAAGDYWFIDVPANVYGHIFFPITGLTYQVRGPAKVQVGAATFWCDNGGSTPHDGQYQMVDAKKLADMFLDSNWELAGDGAIGQWVNVPPVEQQPK